MTIPQGAGRGNSSGVIRRSGADWIDPPAPMSQWQRDRAAAPFAVERTEPWYISLSLWLGVIAFPPSAVLLFIAFMETPHGH